MTAAGDRHYATSWFAQQAAEKAIKALYIEQFGALAPRTHDLGLLGGHVGVPADVATDLAVLDPAFDMVRYPAPRSPLAPVDLVDAAMAKDHLEAAERVLTWVRSQLP